MGINVDKTVSPPPCYFFNKKSNPISGPCQAENGVPAKWDTVLGCNQGGAKVGHCWAEIRKKVGHEIREGKKWVTTPDFLSFQGEKYFPLPREQKMPQPAIDSCFPRKVGK